MKSFLKTKDFSVSGEEFELLYDETRQMLITSPVPGELSSYYQSEDYISHTDSKKTAVDKIYQLVKKYSISKKLALINSLINKEKTLLDIGAGTGDFLLQAKKRNWSITGVEPNYHARMLAQEKGISLNEDLDALSGERFEIITLWHVLEHLPNLEEQILKISNRLEENGTLVIAVPNFKSYDAKHYKDFWAAYDTPRHLWHFSQNSIHTIFSKHGLKVVDTRPMIFDAFYVSLLSEKYKTGKGGILAFSKALFRGLLSNISAWRSKEYSSLIYILRKA